MVVCGCDVAVLWLCRDCVVAVLWLCCGGAGRCPAHPAVGIYAVPNPGSGTDGTSDSTGAAPTDGDGRVRHRATSTATHTAGTTAGRTGGIVFPRDLILTTISSAPRHRLPAV